MLISSFFSCKNETEPKLIKKIDKGNFKISVDFPDTVYINKRYNGRINYKNDLDSLTTKLLDVKKFRLIEYAFLITNNINYDVKHLKTIVKDTIYTNNNRFIPLSAISFNKLGVNYLDGIITDEVNIDTLALREGKMQASTRIISDDFRVTHKVIVIERK